MLSFTSPSKSIIKMLSIRGSPVKYSIPFTVFIFSTVISSFSSAATVTVEFSGTFDQHIIGEDTDPIRRFIYDDSFAPINFNGAFTFDSGIVSSNGTLIPDFIASSQTVFGEPTFLLPTAIETALNLSPSTTSNLDFSESTTRYSRTRPGARAGLPTSNTVEIREQKFGVLEFSDGSYDLYRKSILIGFSLFSTMTTEQQAGTPIDLLGFLNFIQTDIDTQKQRDLFVSAAASFCVSQGNCVNRETVGYTGTLVMTGMTTVPLPATAWLFGSSLVWLLMARRNA